MVFQIHIFGSKYKIQEGLKPDRNNAREGRIVGRDAEGARRSLCAAYPPRPRGATAVRRPDRLQWPIVQVVPSRPTSVRTQCHGGTPVLVPDTWSLRALSPPDEDQNTCDRRLPLVWRRCIHAATDTVVRRPHGRLPGHRLARLDHLARRRRLAEEAPGSTAPKLRGAHMRNSAQGVLMQRQTWRTPDVTAPPRPMVRNAPRGARAPPAWRPGTKFFKQNSRWLPL